MSFSRLSLAFLISLLPWSTQLNAASTTRTGLLNGQMILQVLDSNKKPLAGVQLEITDSLQGKRQTTKKITDSNGQASIDSPTSRDLDGRYISILASTPGLVPTQVTWTFDAKRNSLPESYSMILEAGNRIGGFVKDANAIPIRSASVSLLIPVDSREDAVPYPAIWDYTVKTDDKGFWTCDIIPANADQVLLKLSHPDFISDTRYNESARFSIDQLRELSGVAFMKRGYRLFGTVTDSNGKAVAKAQLLCGSDRWGTTLPAVRTNAQGNYKFTSLAPGSSVITIQAKNYAPQLKIISLNEPNTRLDFKLDSGKTISGKVTDPNGNPIAGVTISADTWKDYRTIDLRTTTDLKGNFNIEHAPAGDVFFNIIKENYSALRGFPISSSSGRQYAIKLNPVLAVTGTVVDSGTGQPIPSFKVIQGIKFKSSTKPTWHVAQAQKFTDGRFEFNTSFPYDAYLVKIEADGYKPAVSREYNQDERNVQLDIRLDRVLPLTGVVFASPAKPALSAMLVPFTNELSPQVSNGRLVSKQEHKTYETSQDGRFSITSPEDLFNLLVLHTSGYLVLDAVTSPQNLNISLKPWSTVEGTFKAGSKPVANEPVSLNYYLENDDPNKARVLFSCSTTTDQAGHFTFKNAIIGKATISRDVRSANSNLTLAANSQTVQVGPGINTVNIGGSGRPVIGRILKPAGADQSFDFLNSVCSLDSSAEIPYPAGFENFSIQQKQMWMKDFFSSPEGKAFKDGHASRSLVIPVNPDGTFRVDDVLAGNYIARLNFYDRKAMNGNFMLSKMLGIAELKVVVPPIKPADSDAPLDIGTIQLKKPE